MVNKDLIIITTKALIAGGQVTYDKAIETTKDTFTRELQTTYGKKLAAVYSLLEKFVIEREKTAEKRYKAQWHNTILCTCRSCDPQSMWRTKGMRELKKSWL